MLLGYILYEPCCFITISLFWGTNALPARTNAGTYPSSSNTVCCYAVSDALSMGVPQGCNVEKLLCWCGSPSFRVCSILVKDFAGHCLYVPIAYRYFLFVHRTHRRCTTPSNGNASSSIKDTATRYFWRVFSFTSTCTLVVLCMPILGVQ